jgi:23S rRNA (cytosine1962-C5)-methyltransferase
MSVEIPQALDLLAAPPWPDYELLDSGAGAKLERFGPYVFVRPEPQAAWSRRRPPGEWTAAHGVFESAAEKGQWQFSRPVPERWQMSHGALRFWAQATAFRHMGVFPEQACHWDWAVDLIRSAARPVRVLNLFGYTGLFTLATAAAGAQVTHVDASKTTLAWARENQELSGLTDRPIRWLLDDALKFVRREARRGSRYEGMMIDPPKFGRGPKGEVWKLEESLPALLKACRATLSDAPLFVILSCYAIRASALSLCQALGEMTAGLGGRLTAGELVVPEAGGGRALSQALFARWTSAS